MSKNDYTISRSPPAERAKKYMKTHNSEDLGPGGSAFRAKMFVPSDDPDEGNDDGESPKYRKPKGFSDEQQALRVKLIKDIKKLTGDKNYDGVGHRLKTEEGSHRWSGISKTVSGLTRSHIRGGRGPYNADN